MLKYLISVVLCATVPVVQAQVRVIDSSPQSVRSGAVHQQESVEQKTEAYNQIQFLQKEVAELRGLVEEQGHEISRLKQLQLDNYVDLDRRVAILSGANPKNLDASPSSDTDTTTTESSNIPSIVVNSPAGISEVDEYKAAYDLLRQRKVDESAAAFKDYLKAYPKGDYAGNSCYWLGEIYLLKNQLPQAREWFSKLIEGFPDSNKVPDAKFKLGKVYHLMGDKNRAKVLLNDAATGAGDSARLAKQYLKDNNL